MLTFKGFTVLLIISGTPSSPPTVVRTFNEADSFEQCRAKAQDIEADAIWKRPIKALCYPTSLIAR